MWLTFHLFITSLLYYSSFSIESSDHLCVFAVNIHQLYSNIPMCFAKSKTLQYLREAHEKNTLSTDLGFNWDDNCDYLSYDSLEKLQTNKNDLRVLHLNIRGLKGKLTELNNLLVRLNNPEIIILNEAWLKEGDIRRINIPSYKYEGVPRLNKKGGEVGFLIRSDLQYRNRHTLNQVKKILHANNATLK